MNVKIVREKVIFVLSLIFLFCTSCQKDVLPENYTETSSLVQNLNIEVSGLSKAFIRRDGGYIITYNKEVNQSYISPGVVVIDENGVVISNRVFGGSFDDIITQSVMDDQGNIICAGFTNSPELRMDRFINQVDKYDGYLIKIDQDGNKIWERGFSDTTEGAKGANNDRFATPVVIGDRIYCVGSTRNIYYPPHASADYDNWLVVFDRDGNLVSQRTFPSLRLNEYSGPRNFAGTAISGNDILLHWSTPNFGIGLAKNFDTAAYMIRYNPESDQIKWIKYYLTGTDEANVSSMTRSYDGNVITVTDDFAMVIKINLDNGEVISKNSIDQYKSAQPGITYVPYDLTVINSFDNAHFIYGSASEKAVLSYAGGYGYFETSDDRPWLLKFSDEGQLIYSKILDMNQAQLGDILEIGEGNFLITGNTNAFSSRRSTIFLLTVDKDGNLIAPK